MEKRKRWHLYLIVVVLGLTLYNILPTVFYYSKPLSQPVDASRAADVSEQISLRVNGMQPRAIEWLKGFSTQLGLKPQAIQAVEGDAKFIRLTFKEAAEATLFRRYLPRAGALIPFVPAQLTLGPVGDEPNEVLVERQVATHLDPSDAFFSFTTKTNAQGSIAPFYRTLVYDRAARIASCAGGVSESARLVQAASDPNIEDAEFVALSQSILDFQRSFGLESPITRRYYASFTQVTENDRSGLIHGLTARLERVQRNLADQIGESDPTALGAAERQRRAALAKQREVVEGALTVLRSHVELFRSGRAPFTESEALAELDTDGTKYQRLDLGGRNPFIEAVVLDWEAGQIELPLYAEVDQLRLADDGTEATAFTAERLNRLLINTIATLSRQSDEQISPGADSFTVTLDALPGSQSLLTLNLGAVAAERADSIQHLLTGSWHPASPDFATDLYPVSDYNSYQNLSLEQQRLGLVVYAPAAQDGQPLPNFRTSSIYVIARGLAQIDQKVAAAGEGGAASQLREDFQSLRRLLASSGFVAYPAAAYGFGPEFQNDYIFELDDYYSYLLMATREDFSVKGTNRYATLEFTDYEQRLLTLNEIETAEHEDLIKWADEYKAAQVDPDARARYSVPPPIQSVFFSNLGLSAKKYFRGDDRKILKWGLDLSGGKSVTIGLRDRHNHPVTDPTDVSEAANQLYSRVNRMGVSEVEIRTEGSNVVLSFPGAQAFSATELVKGSTMFFHIVNEKFTPNNRALAPAVNTFLQEVWNEAVVTGRKDLQSINQLAFTHLGGELDDEGIPRPRSEAAQQLFENGLRLADPQVTPMSSTFDDSLSRIAVFRGESYADWYGQANPLLITFNNFALDGSNLQNVHSQYDPSKGNVLVFSVARKGITPDGATLYPQADFYDWTAHFAKDRIGGTPNELYSSGDGWRMAAVLNDSIISAPHISEPLRDHASVTGNFSQREINQLVADFQAGSLTFTPKILSERNVSPDLGQQERFLGIIAAAIGLAAVVLLMTSYYRFAGLIASCAVIINLFIMWGVLQNLGAALTLPGIAGIILTVGMAVDANVLIFERIREEFRQSGRLAAAVNAGYRRAFSAILDSNLTTLIAALILLHFDAGPIKGFAVTLIIGIGSSLFTALFLTRYFFAGWVQNPKRRELRMANLFKETRFDFLGKAKLAGLLAAAIIVVGGALIVSQRNSIFGMDFTGGYSLTTNLEEASGIDYRKAVTAALTQAGAPSNDLQIRELNRPSQLRIQLGMGLEQRGGPFAGMPQTLDLLEPTYAYQTNPRIVWVVDALAAQGLTLQPGALETLENHWNVMSGQFSETMRNQAFWGLGLALLAILIYITFRFEFKFAISALVALGHDLAVTLGVLAILHALGVAIQIDLQVVGALMTIIGYSLNDTIVIFDRIREEGRLLRKLSFSELINHALNSTLNRTLMTSGTTLLVLLALVVLGGSAIFDFAMVMTVGVVFGTFSSLFVAAPVLRYFHNREQQQSGSVNAATKA